MGDGAIDILVVAVEASGDLHASAVLRELKALVPGVRAFGAAGSLLRAEGCEALVRAEDLSVMGIAEVIPALPRIFRALSTLTEAARARKPKVALLVDSPDFNLRLAARLKPLGVPVVDFIGPTVWAWRSGRTRQIARDVAKMLVILPFEPAFYARHGVQAVYVGNPVADRHRDSLDAHAIGEARALQQGKLPWKSPTHFERGPQPAPGVMPETLALDPVRAAQSAVRTDAVALAPYVEVWTRGRKANKTALGFDPERPLVALLPGSRRQEIKRLWPVLIETARLLKSRRGTLQLAVPVAHTVDRAALEQQAHAAGVHDLHFLDGQAPELLSACDAAAVASGTATLEAALAMVPQVVIYKTSWLTYAIARLMVNVQHIGLVNLLADERLAPELLQRACTAEAICRELEPLLDDELARRNQLVGLLRVRGALLPPGAPPASRKAAEEVAALLTQEA